MPVIERKEDVMPIEEIEIASLPQFIEAVLRKRDEWTGNGELLAEPWFRGHRDSTWDLIPGLYRTEDPNEAEIRGEFKRRGMALYGTASCGSLRVVLPDAAP